MIRFYGLSFKETMSLTARNFNTMWNAIDVLEAQEHIALCRAISYPNLKKAAMKQRDDKLVKAAYPSNIYKKKAQDVNFLLQKLGGKNG